MTAVDRPDNGQDEAAARLRRFEAHMAWRGQRAGSLMVEDFAFLAGWDAALASGRAGAGEQQREIVARWLGRFRDPSGAWEDWTSESQTELSEAADELLALLGGPQPDDGPEPCRVYSDGADGWHCAVTGDHDQHTNAAGDVTW